MPQPVYLPTLPSIPGKPNILRGGDPCSNGATVAGLLIGGPTAEYFSAEPIINLGSRACYSFGDEYCYYGSATPQLGATVATDLSNYQHYASTTNGPMTYADGGFVFTATNATDGTGTPLSQGISFVGTDLVPTAEVSNHFVSTIWLGIPTAAPTSTTNALLFTYPDGSTWSLVAGVYTFTPMGQAAIPIPAAQTVWSATNPLQLGYSIDASTNATVYSVSLYVNGQKSSTTNYATAYTPGTPAFIGFGPKATAATALFGYIAMRFYMENTTVSTNNPAIVVAADYLINGTDLTQLLATNKLPSP